MKYNPEKHHRRSVRLRGYDYSQSGAYFVTICAWHKECIFGEIIERKMKLNEYGLIVQKHFDRIQKHFLNIEIETHVIMPNHMHGIIVINSNCRGGVPPPPLTIRIPMHKGGETPPLRKPALGQVVAYFKYQSSKQINQIRNTPGMPVWQRNYFERVIRNEKELHKIRGYIINNPLKWELDSENPFNI